MVTRFMELRERLLDWLAPGDCMGCGAELLSAIAWCPACSVELEPNAPSSLDGLQLLAPYRHAGAIRDAIHRLKYQNRSDYARRLVASVFPRRRPAALDGVTLIPVPLHPCRLIERGYNQSALLARALGSRWALPVRYGSLLRTVSTDSQVGRDRAARAANMRDVFAAPLASGALCRAWLVDDVVTTGATAASCRSALDAAGIMVSGILALSRAQAPVRPNDAIG